MNFENAFPKTPYVDGQKVEAFTEQLNPLTVITL